MVPRRFSALSLVLALGVSACMQEAEPLGVAEADLTAAERRVRLTQIRDAAAARGLTNGVLLAGIAQNETGLAHCWSEATWACQGPNSVDCGDGPVIAGAGDGPCADMQGGLGMFQFDAGTYTDTLAREGDRILTIAGNVEAAIDFCIAMVVRSVYIDGVDTPEQALAWMNSVVVGGAGHMEWIQTVTHYYNGCTPTGCSVYDTRFMHYSDALHLVYDEMGAAFWSTPATPCDVVPPEGRVIDDTDACVLLGGDLRYWRTATDAGYGGSLRWTNAIDATGPSNYAVWTLRFAEAGEHELVVHTASPYAESHMAPYRITHAGGSTDVAIDQASAEEHSLGTFTFEAGTDYQVHLGDDSGKPVADMIGIVCDALEVIPVAPPTPDAGTSAPDAGTRDDAGISTADAYVPPGVDGGTWMRPTSSPSCGCRASTTEPSWALAGLVGGLGLALTRRTRRTARGRAR